eukprot:2859220-Rhodomonas_salina.1
MAVNDDEDNSASSSELEDAGQIAAVTAGGSDDESDAEDVRVQAHKDRFAEKDGAGGMDRWNAFKEIGGEGEGGGEEKEEEEDEEEDEEMDEKRAEVEVPGSDKGSGASAGKQVVGQKRKGDG